ncbi:hypothetical protein NQ314_017590 [Rhamnusium bicolor]|uniref:MMS19 nucleotide excision repair protein n=1 Tax=Rhamnusium bicolor TaxID=1586634 RepID=A0AAV8WVE9_9CUCU|nr:hypothetical protein NQ314_017590 [Rhamnusium bicolor]
MREGCSIFDTSSYTQHALEIWSQIQKEIFSDSDDEIKNESLRTLTTIINKISQSNEERFTSILKDISITVKGNLLPGSKLFEPSANILLYVALASQECATYMMKEVIPLLTNTFNIITPSAKKAIILKTVIPFVKAYLNQCNEVNLTEYEELETVPILCLKASMEEESSLKATGFDGLSDLVENLPLPIRMSVYRYLHKIIIIPQEQNVRISVLNCFKNLSTIYQDEINEYVLYKTKINDPCQLDLYLNALNVIANLNYFKDIVSDTLLYYAAENIHLAVVAVKNLKQLLEKESKNIAIIETFLQKRTVKKFVNYAITEDIINRNSNHELLLYIASILKILIGSQRCEIQSNIIKQQLHIIDNFKEKSEEVYVFLLDGLLSRFRKAVPLDHNILDMLTTISLTNKNDLVRDIATQLLANLINKQAEGEHLNHCLDIIKKHCLKTINSSKSNVIVTLSWITKALVMRNHFQGNLWTELVRIHPRTSYSLSETVIKFIVFV